MCVKRIFVFENIYEIYLRRYVEETRRWNVGNGLQPNVKMGPVHTRAGRATTESQVEDAVIGGARVEAGAERPEGVEYQNGFFYLPTVLTNASYNSKVAQGETSDQSSQFGKLRTSRKQLRDRTIHLSA